MRHKRGFWKSICEVSFLDTRSRPLGREEHLNLGLHVRLFIEELGKGVWLCCDPRLWRFVMGTRDGEAELHR